MSITYICKNPITDFNTCTQASVKHPSTGFDFLSLCQHAACMMHVNSWVLPSVHSIVSIPSTVSIGCLSYDIMYFYSDWNFFTYVLV